MNANLHERYSPFIFSDAPTLTYYCSVQFLHEQPVTTVCRVDMFVMDSWTHGLRCRKALRSLQNPEEVKMRMMLMVG
jgi:hypothetical protein